MKIIYNILLTLMLTIISTLVLSDVNAPISPLQLHEDQSSGVSRPRTVYDDMKKSKEGMAPRKVRSKFNYAGINPKTSHLSTLSNEALEKPVSQLPVIPKP